MWLPIVGLSLAGVALFAATALVLDAVRWYGLSSGLFVYAVALGVPAVGIVVAARRRGFGPWATFGLVAATVLGVIVCFFATWILLSGDEELDMSSVEVEPVVAALR